jgi:hypothetical protein
VSDGKGFLINACGNVDFYERLPIFQFLYANLCHVRLFAHRQAMERSVSTERQNGKGKKQLTSDTLEKDPDYGEYVQVLVSPSPLGV